MGITPPLTPCVKIVTKSLPFVGQGTGSQGYLLRRSKVGRLVGQFVV
jgi:hypothetical protein